MIKYARQRRATIRSKLEVVPTLWSVWEQIQHRSHIPSTYEKFIGKNSVKVKSKIKIIEINQTWPSIKEQELSEATRTQAVPRTPTIEKDSVEWKLVLLIY